MLEFNDCTWFFNIVAANSDAVASRLPSGYEASSTDPAMTAGADAYACETAVSSATGVTHRVARMWIVSVPVLAPEDVASNSSDDTFSLEWMVSPPALAQEFRDAGFPTLDAEVTLAQGPTGWALSAAMPGVTYDFTLTGPEPMPETTNARALRTHTVGESGRTFVDFGLAQEQRLPFFGAVAQVTGGALSDITLTPGAMAGPSALNVGRFSLVFERSLK